MMKYLILLASIALAASALPRSTHLAAKAGLAAPSRITVITKNSEYPRLSRDGLATQGFARGQWI